MFYHLCNRTATVTLSLLVMTLQINAFFFLHNSMWTVFSHKHGTHVSLTYALYVSICAAKCGDAVIFSSGSKLFMCDDYR